MSKVFFTGCTHFDHANIIGLAGRPFTDVNDMNQFLVNVWNATVKNNDEVFVLGDFVYGGVDWKERATYWNSVLNGRKYLIVGNHDDVNWVEHREMDYGFRGVYNYLDLKRSGKRFILFHYPMEDWDGRYRGSIHLHCHTHQKLLERPSIPYIETSGLANHPNDAPSAAALTLPGKFPSNLFCNRFNVTVEATNYTPISMDEIIARSEYRND